MHKHFITAAAAAAAIVAALTATAAQANPDLNSCGVVWSHDEGNISVWRATRNATVAVGEQSSWGNWSETHVRLVKGNLLRIKMNVQGARCLTA